MNIQEDEQIRTYMSNFEEFAKDCIILRDHNTASLVPFKFNKGQRIFHAICEKQKAEKGYVRIMLLKSRRFGGSTYAEGRFYWQASMKENRNVFIVGHEEKSTATLFSMAKLMQERNPLAPSTKKSNAQELIFDNEQGTGLKSQYALATARNLGAGRSQGIHYLHLSEEALYEHGADLLYGLFQCIPPAPMETEVIRESTANGYGNTFQEDVFKAYAEGEYPYYEENGVVYAYNSKVSEWILVFIPWFIHERYTLPFENDVQKKEFEIELYQKVYNKELNEWVLSEALRTMEKFNLTFEQLNWRRDTIANKCRDDIDYFHQEYPATVEDAFLSTGSNVFPKSMCDDLEEYCTNPIVIGNLTRRGTQTVIRRNEYGHFRLWVKPEKKETYFLTVDVAGGKKERHTQAKIEPDYTVIDVWNHRTGEQVAQWHGHIEYDLVGDLVCMIGHIYGMAVAAVELMNHGYTVVADLKREKYPMFEHRSGEPGWLTTPKTKPQMIDSLYRFAKASDIKINCKATISEMRTFIEEGMKYTAAKNCKDDRVITAAMASQMMMHLPEKFRKSRNVEIKNWDNKSNNSSNRDCQEYYA